MAQKGTKFEYALYVDGNKKEKYTVNELTAMRNNNLLMYNQTKIKLYCPYCGKARLTHRCPSEKNDHFTTIPHEIHETDCSAEIDYIPSKYLIKMKDVPKDYNMHNRLTGVLANLFLADNEMANPATIVDIEVNSKTPTTSLKQRTTTRYKIPRKLLTNDKILSEFKGIKIFYGKVIIKWYEPSNQESNSYYNHYMHILNPDKLTLICSVKFKDRLYRQIDEKYKQKDSPFKVGIAFFTDMIVKCDNKGTFLNSEISDLDNIVFYDL